MALLRTPNMRPGVCCKSTFPLGVLAQEAPGSRAWHTSKGYCQATVCLFHKQYMQCVSFPQTIGIVTPDPPFYGTCSNPTGRIISPPFQLCSEAPHASHSTAPGGFQAPMVRQFHVNIQSEELFSDCI